MIVSSPSFNKHLARSPAPRSNRVPLPAASKIALIFASALRSATPKHRKARFVVLSNGDLSNAAGTFRERTTPRARGQNFLHFYPLISPREFRQASEEVSCTYIEEHRECGELSKNPGRFPQVQACLSYVAGTALRGLPHANRTNGENSACSVDPVESRDAQPSRAHTYL